MKKKPVTLAITTNKLRKYIIKYNDDSEEYIFAKYIYSHNGVMQFMRHEFSESDSIICYIPLTTIKKVIPTDEWKDEEHPYREKLWFLVKHTRFLNEKAVFDDKTYKLNLTKYLNSLYVF